MTYDPILVLDCVPCVKCTSRPCSCPGLQAFDPNTAQAVTVCGRCIGVGVRPLRVREDIQPSVYVNCECQPALSVR